MKRGLVVLNPSEVAPEEYAARVRRFQQVLRASGCGLGLVYGDVSRFGDIGYLTNLCLYWNEGILAVPVEGEPAFLTKLSPRVHPWMRATSTVSDLRSGADLARLAADVAGASPEGSVGLVEEAWWPAPLVEAIRAEIGDRRVCDLGPAIRQLRRHPSEAERALLRHSAELAAAAVEAAAFASGDSAERVAAAERAVRRAGARDVRVWCDPIPGEGVTVEAFVEWRGYWTHTARTVLPDGARPGTGALFAQAYREAEKALRPGARRSQVQEAVGAFLADRSREVRWSVDLVEHVDLETLGEHRTPEIREMPLFPGAVVSLALRVQGPGGFRWVAADTYEVRAGGAERLTSRLPETA